MSYRQINHWDSTGALPNRRTSERGWRRYSILWAFAILVCPSLRRQLGLSADKIRAVSDWLRDEESGRPFEYSIYLINTLGTPIWLVTDCDKLFWIRPDFGIARDWEEGYFFGEDEMLISLVLKQAGIAVRAATESFDDSAAAA